MKKNVQSAKLAAVTATTTETNTSSKIARMNSSRVRRRCWRRRPRPVHLRATRRTFRETTGRGGESETAKGRASTRVGGGMTTLSGEVVHDWVHLAVAVLFVRI